MAFKSKNTIGGKQINRNYKNDKLCRRNHDNIKRLLRTIDNTVTFESHPIGNVVNLNKSTFSKESFKLLNKILNFAPTPKVYT